MSNSFTATVHAEGYASVQLGDFTKRISIGDYIKALGSISSECSSEESGTAYRYPSSIHSSMKASDGYILNLYYPAREATLSHSNGLRYPIYMPNVMIKVHLKEVAGKTGEYSIGRVLWFATDRSSASLPTEWPSSGTTQNHIWTLPLPNMYDNSTMCTGGNRLPSVIYSDWSVLDMLYNDVLLGSPFNNDLSIRSTRGLYSGATWLDIVKDHCEKEENTTFPYHLLLNY